MFLNVVLPIGLDPVGLGPLGQRMA